MSDIQSSSKQFYPCEVPECKYRGSSLKLLRFHRQRVHFGKFSSCNRCEYKTRNSSDLKKHQRIHTGSKPYTCSSCSKSFTSLSNLISHTRAHHPDSLPPERRLTCEPCKYQAVSTFHLKRHLKSKTHQKRALANGIASELNVTPPAQPQTKKISSTERHVEAVELSETEPEADTRSCTASSVESEALQELASKVSKKFAKYQRRIQKGKTLKNNTFKCTFCDYATDDVWEFLAHLRSIPVTQH